MPKTLTVILIYISCTSGFSQSGWEWEYLGSMPEPVSNHAFVEAFCGDTLCFYSFTGIGSELNPADIHLKSWRYNTVLSEWQTLPDVNDFMGEIATGASTVGDTIYLIGGYHVFSNFNEQTSEKVHRFNTSANSWMENGTDIPIPIDDHVQAVWRDSLIYVVTGWSNTTNTAAVQVYNPYLDEWTAASSVPTSSDYRAFGASGTIIGDTIYYFGGVQISGFNFLANKKFRKGVINPENPTEISWEYLGNADVESNGYRMACTNFQNEAIWIGGAGIAYNFDALAYSNNQVVEPLGEIRTFNVNSGNWTTAQPSPFSIMDLRGIAREDQDSWVIAGGITNNQTVSDQMWRITRATVGVDESDPGNIRMINHNGQLIVSSGKSIINQAELYAITGLQIILKPVHSDLLSIDTQALNSGLYILRLQFQSGQVLSQKVVVTN